MDDRLIIRDKNGKWEGSGNPKGKPRGSKNKIKTIRQDLEGKAKSRLSLTTLLRQHFADHPEDAEAIIANLITLSKQRDPIAIKAIREILDRIDGRVIERHQVGGEIPVKLLFVPAQELLHAPETHLERKRGGALESKDEESLAEGQNRGIVAHA